MATVCKQRCRTCDVGGRSAASWVGQIGLARRHRATVPRNGGGCRATAVGQAACPRPKRSVDGLPSLRGWHGADVQYLFTGMLVPTSASARLEAPYGCTCLPLNSRVGMHEDQDEACSRERSRRAAREFSGAWFLLR
eukprot:362822-Chlamydomonas_euryale.AAC.37